MSKQEFALAEQQFSRQIEINPKSSVVYTQLAMARARQDNREGAVAAMRQGLEALPGDTRLLTGLAGMYTQWGDLDKAATVFEQALAEFPDNQQIALGLAGIRERQQQYDAAIEIYERLHQQDPENLILINNLAALLSDHRKDEKSLARAKDLALKLADSKQPALLDTLGWVHYRLGEYDQAAAVLSGVVEQAPEVPVFRYHLGMTYYRQGDTRAAKDILSGAVADEYNYAGVDEARRVYAELAGS
jgi:tetratricopeptide (TPR) repeat protein